MIKCLLAAALLLTGAAAGSGEGADAARRWLEKSHLAAGGAAWDDVRSSRARFGIELPGMSGTAETVTDLTTGRYVSDATVGTLRFVNGLDDSVQWSRDPSGQVHAPDSQGEREASVSERFRRMLAYWYPERWPAELSDLGEVSEGGRAFRRVRIVPEGGRAFDFWIDAQTSLIDRIVENDGTRDETIYLYDYHAIDGRRVPHATRFSTGEAQYDQFTMLQSIEVNVALEDGMFAMPAARAVGATARFRDLIAAPKQFAGG